MPPKPIEPVRPTPAVGQVWRDTKRFLICEDQGRPESPFYMVYENGTVLRDFDSAWHCVSASDTYIGKFAGFRIGEDGE